MPQESIPSSKSRVRSTSLAISALFAFGLIAGSAQIDRAFAVSSPEPAPPKPAKKDKKKKSQQKKNKKQPTKKQNFGAQQSGFWPDGADGKFPELVPIQAMLEAGDYSGAIVQLNGLNRPDDANVLNMLGYAHRKLGLIEVGIRYYLAALENNPRHKGVHEYLAEAYLQKDDLKKAEILLKKLGQICGVDCREYKELAEAIAEYKSAHSL